MGASEGEFCAVVGQPVPPDRVDMVATLGGELDPDAWPVDAHVVAPIAQVLRARVGHLDLIELGLVELAVFCALRAITGPGRDRFLDEFLRGIGKLGDRNSLALGGELAVFCRGRHRRR